MRRVTAYTKAREKETEIKKIGSLKKQTKSDGCRVPETVGQQERGVKKNGESTPVACGGVGNESWFHVAPPRCSKMSERREDKRCLGLSGCV